MPTLVTLLSDFGSHSPYPAAMKAVLVSCGQHLLVDISHDVPRHDVRAGAYLLSTIAPFVPAGTVHLAVVDPGVGTARRPLIVASGGQYFVGPDNGLLLPAARRVGRPRPYVITDERLVRAVRSTTFHGRDLFAPAAALLARGTPPEALGVPASEVVDLEFGTGRLEGEVLVGEVIYIDPFGNVITNLPVALLPAAGRRVAVRVGRREASASVGRTYADGVRGRPVVVPGSDGFVEIAVREGSAVSVLRAVPGTSVRIRTLRGRPRRR
ncbi:MAG: SAM-dependent chlorinase/fluorinase [Armatimonadota bacterium]|nr:SAM-dependent chlorinase/fluorinase [Armatimonadota bacterium]MDR7451875.1 SAM-dependent chlorinase/fluorinase [Armatimonadota bacterium]MDR7467600.1 SAM-dependent chlorinase/fluorinase [Armatimonadota bacterium]MDR7494439.1 SAM-dependent chlorinase/fluorinase [Armatimonadota bacterium]MDR7500419.1 SAM-dependent chlorinase/fluorinase [Armatimonadota bacterium]